MITLQEAKNLILSVTRTLPSEEVRLEDSLNRVLSHDISADRDYPPFNRVMMDGYAIRSEDLNEGISTFDIVGTVHAGDGGIASMKKGESIKIMTGAPLPPDPNAVIRREDTTEEAGRVTINLSSVIKWKNIARKAEDCSKGDTVIAAGTQINPTIVNVLAVTGHHSISVHSLPKVVIISTGNELIPVDRPILPHQIRDSNGHVLSAFFNSYNISAIRNHAPDNPEALEKAFSKALRQADIIVSTGGVSMGDADLVPGTLKRLGVRELFHKTQIKPGKPIWFGEKEGTVVFGLPGNPMSCQVGFKVFIEPFLRKSLGLPRFEPWRITLSENHRSRSKFDEYFPGKLFFGNKNGTVKCNSYNGSGDITSMIGSDGLIIHPSNITELKEGDIVSFIPWK